MSLPTLRGSRVTLRPMVIDEAALVGGWFNDPEFQRRQWAAWRGQMAPGEARDFIRRFDVPDAGIFAIEFEGRAIGFANFRRLNELNSNADIGIGIGERELWGRGLGPDALRLLLDYLCGDRGLHRIRLHVAATNDRAILAYRKCGFELEGIERESIKGLDGTFSDMAVMGYLHDRTQSSIFAPRPVTLVGTEILLEPLRMEHAESLFRVADEPGLWTYFSSPQPLDLVGMAGYIRRVLDDQVAGTAVPFLVRRVTGEVVGTTRYLHIDFRNRSLEIGGTFYGQSARRTRVNTEAKSLLLRHAFETLGAARVWLQTDELNLRSQAAIERLGAVREGLHRKDRIRTDGRIRSSVYFSVVDSDWPGVGERLARLLAR